MKLFLLPASFKKVGIILAILTLIIGVLSSFIDFTYRPQSKPLLNQMIISFFCVSLFFLNFYKQKTEDDKLLKIRMQCLFISFLFTIKYLVLLSIVQFLDGHGLPHTAPEILFIVLLFNLCMMYGMTRKVKRAEADEPETTINNTTNNTL